MNGSLTRFVDMVPKVNLADRARAALLVVDMQYHDASPEHGLTHAMNMVAPGSMAYYSERLQSTTIPAIRRLLEFFRANGIAVIHLMLGSNYRDLRDCPPRFRAWTRNLETATGATDLWWTGNPEFASLAELAPLKNETVIQKTTNGAFNGSEIDTTLQRMGISTLIITGVVTSACIETTARDAADRGYNCILVEEANADYDPDMHNATMTAFALNFGRIVNSAEDLISAIRLGHSV